MRPSALRRISHYWSTFATCAPLHCSGSIEIAIVSIACDGQLMTPSQSPVRLRPLSRRSRDRSPESAKNKLSQWKTLPPSLQTRGPTGRWLEGRPRHDNLRLSLGKHTRRPPATFIAPYRAARAVRRFSRQLKPYMYMADSKHSLITCRVLLELKRRCSQRFWFHKPIA